MSSGDETVIVILFQYVPVIQVVVVLVRCHACKDRVEVF